ncbi:MAG: bifunctional 4-hydroxy-2-oxoglutarate aldolase/2-dehydro-3-deoxy-phosphogluconate aldolase [Halolamina sp.]
MNDELQRLVDEGVVAVLRGTDPDALVETVTALQDGGVSAVELTADSSGVTEMLEELDATFGDDVLVGAGTVLDGETARATLLAGAEFVVSPSLHHDVVDVANRYGAPVAPGVMTPTEAITAYEAGADLVKVFPAKTVGPDHLAAMKGPLGQVPMMPTGGIDADNVADYVAAGADVVGAGSGLVPGDAVANGDYDRITETATSFVAAFESAREAEE